MNQLVFRTVLGQVSKCESGWYIEPVDRNMESFDLGPCTAFTKSRTAASESLQPDRCESAKTGQQRFRRLHSRDHVDPCVDADGGAQGGYFIRNVSTVCHEFCHRLDFQRFGFADSWHSRGFNDRASYWNQRTLGATASAPCFLMSDQ